MSNQIVSNGLLTNGIFSHDDYNAIVNFYNTQMNFTYYTKNKGDLITATDWNNLISSLSNFSSLYTISGLPNTVNKGDIIKSVTWPYPVLNQQILRYTTSATYRIPNGCNRICLNWIIAGGGGGGGGMEEQYGGSGGSGGSGGYYQNYYMSVSPGDYLEIDIGNAGQGTQSIPYGYGSYSTSGGDTVIKINSNEVLRVTGGGNGVNGSENSGGMAGMAGTPNGSSGNSGIRGNSPHTGHGKSDGVQGASSPFGPGGTGGSSANTDVGNGGSASVYGAGGGSGANVDGSYPFFWAGGNGGQGYVEIKLPV